MTLTPRFEELQTYRLLAQEKLCKWKKVPRVQVLLSTVRLVNRVHSRILTGSFAVIFLTDAKC